jgi:tricorn protease
MFRDGDDLGVPVNGRTGAATVLMIDEENGSAAETFAFMFKLRKLGPIVGLRTFGAGIGPYGANRVPGLVDGGRIRIPSRGAYDPSGSWGIENDGVHPDLSVDIAPEDWRAGRDPQLEAAIKAGLDAIASQPPTEPPKRPKFPEHP